MRAPRGPPGLRHVCGSCVTHPRLRGLLTGHMALLTLTDETQPDRCVFCGLEIDPDHPP